jgi:two-component system response regulator AlgR
VVDDEPLARERLSHLVEELPEVELAWRRVGRRGKHCCSRAACARMSCCSTSACRAWTGSEAARHLARMPEPPAVIFTTAYDQHALAAFDAQAAGYLLKPVRQDKLREALERRAARRARSSRGSPRGREARARASPCARATSFA